MITEFGLGMGKCRNFSVSMIFSLFSVVPTVKFGQSNYSVLENAGNLIVEVLVEYQVPNR